MPRKAITMTNQPMTRGHVMGLFDDSGNFVGSAGPDASLYAVLSNRLPNLPTVPGGVTTPAIDKAMAAAQAAIEAADDIITEQAAYEALTRTPEELAERDYRKALAAGDGNAEYSADQYRQIRIRVEYEYGQALKAAKAAVATARQVVKAEASKLVEGSNERLIAARRAWEQADAAARAARRAFAQAADDRAALIVPAGEAIAVNIESMLRNAPVSLAVVGPVHVEPWEAVTNVIQRLRSLGAQGLDDVATGPSASADQR